MPVSCAQWVILGSKLTALISQHIKVIEEGPTSPELISHAIESYKSASIQVMRNIQIKYTDICVKWVYCGLEQLHEYVSMFLHSTLLPCSL